MFIFDPIVVATVSQYRSSEIHITGKDTDNPMAVLSFTPCDTNGNRIPQAPVAIVTLTGAAYNEWYTQWNSESTLYSGLLSLYQRVMAGEQVQGFSLSGVDVSKLAGAGLHVEGQAPEILNSVIA